MPRIRVAFLLCAALTSPALGQTTPLVEFRLVERTGQTEISPSDTAVDIAIQARVTGAAGLSQFAFSVRLPGEAKTSGTWGRGLISNVDGTYASNVALSSVVGRGGIASTYTYLAAINGSFEGQPNGFTNSFSTSVYQELIGVVAATASAALLHTPGVDVDGDANPDTWSGNGTGMIPPNETHVQIDPAIARTYFAQGEFIDVYRFRYTSTNMTSRTLHFTLPDVSARTLNGFASTAGEWGPWSTSVADRPAISTGTLDIQVIPASPVAGVWLFGLPIAARRRRQVA